ncbi:MAG: hypothetical protein FJ368_03285 [Pelagibacterales bacterium]|nr:hypothetical protein [Pelagibacterales bacterium]
MKDKKSLLSLVAVFLFIYAFDFFWHGSLLKPLYDQTPQLWRNDGEIVRYISFCLVIHLVYAMIFVKLFRDFILTKNPISLKYVLSAGLLVGELVGILELAVVIYLPISEFLAIGWFFNRVFQALGVALIMYYLNVKKA